MSPQCSRASCRRPAAHRLDWRNPRLHDAGRSKTWLACDEHLEYLSGFLTARDFPLAVTPIDSVPVNALGSV